MGKNNLHYFTWFYLACWYKPTWKSVLLFGSGKNGSVVCSFKCITVLWTKSIAFGSENRTVPWRIKVFCKNHNAWRMTAHHPLCGGRLKTKFQPGEEGLHPSPQTRERAPAKDPAFGSNARVHGEFLLVTSSHVCWLLPGPSSPPPEARLTCA